jgi:hypothetical protein
MVLSLEWCLGLQEKDDKFEWFEQGSKKGEKLGFGLNGLGTLRCFKNMFG